MAEAIVRTKITLPTMKEQKEAIRLTDWEIGNGAACINSEKRKIGIAWLREAFGRGSVYCSAYGHGHNGSFAGDRRIVARPRIQNPEQSGISTSKANDTSAGNNRPEEFLAINCKVVYYPNTKITGKVQEVRPIDLSFPSDTPLDTNTEKKHYLPYVAKESKCYEVIANGKQGFAVKLEGSTKRNKNSIYHDGTKVVNGATVWFWLEPLPAQRKENGDIQAYNGLPQQFEAQGIYEKKTKDIQFGAELDTDKFQIGKSMGEMMQDWKRSAEVMATLNLTALKQNHGAADTKKGSKLTTLMKGIANKIGLTKKQAGIEQSEK